MVLSDGYNVISLLLYQPSPTIPLIKQYNYGYAPPKSPFF